MPPLRPLFPASALLLLLGACSHDAPAKDERRPVAVLTLSREAHSYETRFTGTIRSAFESQVGFEVAGRIVARAVEPGDMVRAGQVLMRLDAQDYARALDSAEAQSAAARTGAATQRADLARSRELLAKGFISPAEFDQKQAETAQANAQLRAAAAQAGTASAQLGRTTLRAPRAGVVTQVEGEVGQVVGGGQGVVMLADTRKVEIAVALPEGGLDQVRRAAALSVSSWSQPEKRYPAHLHSIAGAADPATRTFAARVTVDVPPGVLAMGESAELHVVCEPARSGDSPASFDVPLSAVAQGRDAKNGARAQVWVVDRKTLTVSPRPVRLGTPSGHTIRVVSGLKPGETLVTAGVQLLHAGEKIRIVDVPAS
ncbi:efflux RND transporter periplasmic adaptor subunit [Novosphingobium profundi]|uniref:efflux RND transporter periplasmic adaptor subunit n=1 Tax=Novosphingobium profundi TaxID=1774954 RepID=UPI001BDAE87E|nr:efflux RND transporter periplasmic adaptor subunit [Novosphingobium profundi]MBT0670927.1 efflux RND transporter periplasmic adaptor subunit [Novosphingobium profundi]